MLPPCAKKLTASIRSNHMPHLRQYLKVCCLHPWAATTVAAVALLLAMISRGVFVQSLAKFSNGRLPTVIVDAERRKKPEAGDSKIELNNDGEEVVILDD